MSSSKGLFSFILNQTIQVVELNPAPVSKESLCRHFQIASEYYDKFDSFLDGLSSKGFIEKISANQFKAHYPIGSLMVVRYSPKIFSRPHSSKYLDLEVLNLQDIDSPVFVRTLRTDILKTLNGTPPREGETFAIVAERRRGTELFAKRVLGSYRRFKKPTITGQFSSVSAGNFTATLKGYGETTRVRIDGDPDQVAEKTKHGLFYVKTDLDPRNPEVKYVGSKWDPSTGRSIPAIIAKKHGLMPGHPRESMKKANRAIQRPLQTMGREDMRDIPFLVIDPHDARDNDDGIYIERMGWDAYRIITIIADMPWYVRSGSHLDSLARKRGFTHYFPDNTFHMLPEPLVQHASLKQGFDKPVVYVESFVDENGKKIDDTNIGIGVIANQRQLSYGQMDNKLNTEPHNYAAYRELGTELVSRMRQESLMFDVDEYGRPKSFSEMLVSSMMVHANAEVSNFLQKRGIPFPSRVHAGRHNPFAYEDFRKKLTSWGYSPPHFRDGVRNQDLKDILLEAERRHDKERVEMAIRAEYLDRAQYSPVSQGHFGLDLDGYCHSTSPIRRYPDNRVLRGVHTALGQRDTGLSNSDWDDLPQVCKEMNQLQGLQNIVAVDIGKHYAVLSLAYLENSSIRAKLHSINANFIEILLPERGGLRGRVGLDNMPTNWKINKNYNSLKYNEKFNVLIGDTLRIRVHSVQPDKGEWQFDLERPTKMKPPHFNETNQMQRLAL